MATEANKLKVGIFLIAGFLLFNGALIWIGASRLMESTTGYVTYFAESVQGLDVGSAVKYRGVPLGRVTAIRVAPDGELVEVRLEIAPEFKVLPGMRATLTSSGLTGLALVEIGFPPAGAAPSPPPALAFTPPGPYIPSRRSFLTDLMSALTEIAAQMRATDLPGLAAEYRELASAANRRLAGPEVDRALRRISQAADALDGLTRKVTAMLEGPEVPSTLRRVDAAVEDLASGARSARTLLADPQLAETLEDLRAAAGGLRGFTEEMRAATAGLRAGERLDAVQRRVEGALSGVGVVADAGTQAAARWERMAGEVEHSLQEALNRIGRAAGRLENLARSLEASPARLLEKPAKEDFP